MDADVIVVGGGSAGLQAALTLGRMRFDVVVVDAGEPSNAPAHAIGGLLGAHDTGPLDFLATGRSQLAELPSVRLIDGEATRVEAAGTVTLADGGVLRAVVLPDGAEVPRDVVFVAAPPKPRDTAFAHLALERTGPGLLATDAFGRTSVADVYAAGDLVTAPPALVQALATAQRAAVGVTRDL